MGSTIREFEKAEREQIGQHIFACGTREIITT
jgi:hypothetical protein